MNPDKVARLHRRISDVLGTTLPSAEEESRDPGDADQRYEEAVAALRHRTIGRDRFPLVFEENCEYGFRRNSLGLRGVGLSVALAVLVASSLPFVFGVGSIGSLFARWGTSGVAALVIAAYWGFVVNDAWVHRAAETYADRLFEALESLPRR